jgi:hypothetical protein
MPCFRSVHSAVVVVDAAVATISIIAVARETCCDGDVPVAACSCKVAGYTARLLGIDPVANDVPH